MCCFLLILEAFNPPTPTFDCLRTLIPGRDFQNLRVFEILAFEFDFEILGWFEILTFEILVLFKILGCFEI